MASGTTMNAAIQIRYGQPAGQVLAFSIGRHPSVRCMMWISSGPMFIPISSPGWLAWVEWIIHS